MIKAISIDTRSTTSKGQKIIAALFLVTEHLSESDPLRSKVRLLATRLLDSDAREVAFHAGVIQTLLGAAVIAKMINEKNAGILQTEIGYFVENLEGGQSSIGSLFPVLDMDKGQVLNKRTISNDMSFMLTKRQKDEASVSLNSNDLGKKTKESKSIRHQKILSYINTRKSANIKDISSLFPDVSEKTIQRELGWLVASGKITKRGDKRWSLYLAV